MLGIKNHFDISGSIEIREVDIAGVACTSFQLRYSSRPIIVESRNGHVLVIIYRYVLFLTNKSYFCLESFKVE